VLVLFLNGAVLLQLLEVLDEVRNTSGFDDDALGSDLEMDCLGLVAASVADWLVRILDESKEQFAKLVLPKLW
jgi:hypothetical protein